MSMNLIDTIYAYTYFVIYIYNTIVHIRLHIFPLIYSNICTIL